jgi:hypothetical protein
MLVSRALKEPARTHPPQSASKWLFPVFFPHSLQFMRCALCPTPKPFWHRCNVSHLWWWALVACSFGSFHSWHGFIPAVRRKSAFVLGVRVLSNNSWSVTCIHFLMKVSLVFFQDQMHQLV